MAERRIFTCNLCEAMCGVALEIDGGKVVGVRGDAEDVFSRGHVCPKAFALGELHADPDRLRAPMRRDGSSWRAVSWDEAFDEAADRLRSVRRRYGRDSIAYYLGNPAAHSHRATLGALALAAGLRTRNRYDANSQDSNPRTFACLQMYGSPIAVPIPDIDRTDYFLILGANPAISGGSLMSLGDVRGRLRAVRERGGRVVVIDPRRNETAALADEHHFIRPGGDAAFLLSMLHVVLGEGRVDREAIASIAGESSELEAIAKRYPPERVAESCGIAADVIRRLARDFASAKRAVAYGRIGTCQNAFGPVANWLVDALNVVTGNFDREGGAMFCTPAADLRPLARWVLPSRAGRFHSRARGLPEYLGALPSTALAEEIETPGSGQVRGFVCFAGNPVLSTPDGNRLARALATLDTFVSIDLYLNETSSLAHLIFPPISALETGNYDLLLSPFSVRDFAKLSEPALPRPAEGRDDWEIASELALRLSLPRALAKSLAKKLRGAPDRVVDWLLRRGRYRLSLDQLRKAPHGIDLGPLKPARSERVQTRDGRVRLAPAALVADLPRLDAWIDERRAASLELIGRRHLRSNNSWMHNLPSLAKGPDRSRLLMHPRDAEARKLRDGEAVLVRSRAGSVRVRVQVSDEVMPGVVSLPHGFGHSSARSLRIASALPGESANALTDCALIEPVLGTSILNGVPVEVEAALD